MNKLTREFQRLYLLPGQNAPQIDASAASRLLCLALSAKDWPAAETLLQALSEDLELTLPALSVDGEGFRLWLSFAEAIDAATGTRFVAALRQRYLPELPAERLRVLTGQLTLPPSALDDDGERWAAFIDPGMGSLFVDEPSLDFSPNPDKQAELLAGFTSIPTRAFAQALTRLEAANAEIAGEKPTAAVHMPETAKTIGAYPDPKSFLLAVMNEPGIPLAQRIEAAKALLPYAD